MITTVFSPKGGSGSTTIAAALAVLAARVGPTVLVDAAEAGDIPACLGLPDVGGPGFTDWARGDFDAEVFGRLGVGVNEWLSLIPHGGGVYEQSVAFAERLRDTAGDTQMIVDCGHSSTLAGIGDEILMVLRPCYLALRRALASPVRATGVIVIEEPKRSLDPTDIQEVLGIPVRAVVPWDEAISRCIDAGLLAVRIPRSLKAALAQAVSV